MASVFPVELSLGISAYEVATLDVAEVTQSLMQGLARLGIRGQVLPQVAIRSDLGCLLAVCGDRPPDRNAAEQGYELSPPHATPDLRGCQSIRCRTLALLHREVPGEASMD
jgi:hypothetical protein